MQDIFLLIKPASGRCNMRCKYCFYADITDIRTIKDHGIMSESVLETTIQKALSEARSHCTFSFQGGEPLLAGIDFFNKLIGFEKKYNDFGVKISYTLQTNGLLLDNAWAEFFHENDFLIGLSIDAGKQVHDSFRTDPSGKGTFTRCMASTRLLTKNNVNYNILSVLTRQLARHPDKTYRYYRDNNFRYIQFIPCLDDLSGSNSSAFYSLDAKTYGNFLCRVFDLWYADFSNNDYFSIRLFDNYIQILAGRPAENCAMNGTCTAYALIEADGSVYPCDFYAMDEFLLGNVTTHDFREMLSGEKANAFIAPSQHRDPDCLSCEYYSICRGGCRRDREPVTDGIPSINRYCEAYKKFFAHALPRMKTIASCLQ